MKNTRLCRLLMLLLVVCFSFTCFCACSDDGDFVQPTVTGQPLTGWPTDAVFSSVPQFTAGTFDESQSTLKSGNSLLFFNDVEQEGYDTYYQALVDAGFSDAMAAAGGTTVKNARFTNEDGTVMVSLNYRTATKLLKITLVEVVPSDDEDE